MSKKTCFVKSVSVKKTALANTCLWVVGALLLSACQTPHVSDPMTQPSVLLPPDDKCLRLDEAYCGARWWQVFNDDTFNLLMGHAVANNRELSVASLTLQKALLDVQKHKNAKGLVIQSSAGANRQHKKELTAGESVVSHGFEVGLNASWELDLWGKLALYQNLAEWEKNAVGTDRQAVFLNLTGTVARTYFGLIGTNQKILDNKQSLAFERQRLQFLERQIDIGHIAQADILPTHQAINQLEQSALSLATERAEGIHMLATLTHLSVGEIEALLNNKTKLPALPHRFEHLPANAIANRPDLGAMLWRLLIALEQKKLLQKNQYPTLTLTAGTTAQHANLVDLLKVPVLNWGISLNLPTFNHKEYHRSIEVAKIDEQIALLNHTEAVQKALFDVQNKLIALYNGEQNHTRILQANELAKQQLHYQNKRYELGQISAKDLAESQETYRKSVESIKNSELNQLLLWVAVWQAVGGVQ